MALPINVGEVLRGQVVEWERLEFKKGWNPEPILHTLCAFANDFHNLGGGYLFIGIEEKNGRPSLPPAGVSANELDALQKEILNLGHKITPPYHPVMEPYIIDGQNVLVLWAPGGTSRPYKAPVSLSEKKTRHAYFIRKGSTTVEAKGDDERDLLELAARVPFDDRACQRASLADIQLALVQAHLREIGSDLLAESAHMDFAALCERMKITDGPREHPWPRNVGLLFFNDQPERFFPQVQIDVVELPDGAGGDRIVEHTFTGLLGRQLRDALGYIRNAVIQQEVRKHPDRAEADRFFNYPYAAIEEALVNAVYHRSYEEREPIEVRVLPDHLTITSYPGPDRSISVSDLESGTFVARRYRNRRIGEFLKELKLTEGRGTGVPKIIRAMRANGSPFPRFRTDDDRTYVATILPIHAGMAEVAAEDRGPLTGAVTEALSEAHLGAQLKAQSGAQLEGELGAQSGNHPSIGASSGRRRLTRAERRILIALLDGSLARTELAARLERPSESGALKRSLARLIEEALIERTIPSRPNSRNQRYVLTRLGRTRAMGPDA